MKKVMFLFFGMFLSVSANAASVSITNESGFTYSGDDVYTENTINVEGGFSTNFTVVSAGGAGSTFDVDFTRGTESAEVFLTGYTFDGVTTDLGTITSFSFYSLLSAGFNGVLTIFGTATVAPTSVNLHVSSVPIPAALFLFAPALLGFLGLRRKAALAA